MKQTWKKFATRIDAMSLRERAIIFILGAVVLLVLVNSLLLESQFANQKQVAQKIQQEQALIAGVQKEIQQVVHRHDEDPDKHNRVLLENLTGQLRQMEGALQGVQRGLISPEKISLVLEEILKQNGRLRLISLKTLPPTGLVQQAHVDLGSGSAEQTQKGADPGKSMSNPNALYRHGVQITLSGSYLDMLNYMAALEAMPWQLFWGGAKLDVDAQRTSTLTLTLFTLSLEKKWLNL